MTATLGGPLRPGDPVAHWELGTTLEERFDIPDRPMRGAMDPFFFLTREKNFIPHEYPCRTEYIARQRGRRPEPRGAFGAARLWLPFGAPRVDLSGFWFRPTRLATWARTVIRAERPGPVRLRLATCGAAILFLDGSEAGWLAPCTRNLEAATEIAAGIGPGETEIRIFFEDLAERDARYLVALDWLEGPPAALALPVPAAAPAAERLLAGAAFDRPSYPEGRVRLLLPEPAPSGLEAAVTVEGDFMSTERHHLAPALAPGAAALELGPAGALPADFRHFDVTLSAPGFRAGRRFGVEIVHAAAQGEPPANLSGRIAEALDRVAEGAEPDTVRALARLALGRTGPETEAMIAAMLPAIEDCHDCADFLLVPLLWSRIRWGSLLSPGLRDRIDAAILGYRYWMDEPGNDVQWFFSENHALLFHTAAYLAGDLLPAATFRRSGRQGRAQSATGRDRVRAWLDHFEAWEMAEFNSAPYFPIDLKGLTALFALAPDADIRDRAGRAIGRLAEIVARSAHHGMLTGAQGRSYEHTLRAVRSLELSGLARLLWGRGWYGRRFHCLPQMALCLRDHGLAVPETLGAVARLAAGEQEWCFAQGEGRFAALYHAKTPDWAMGSAAAYRWGEWGYQETLIHLRLGTHPEAQIWINHPGEVIHSGYGRPSYWGGSGTVPRVHQYRGLAVLDFALHEGQPPFTHAWFPVAEFDAARVAGDLALARSGNGLALLRGSGPLELLREGPTREAEIRLAGTRTRWLVRLGTGGDPDRHAARFGGLAARDGPEGAILVQDPDYGPVSFHADGRIEAEGRVLRPRDWSVRGEARSLA